MWGTQRFCWRRVERTPRNPALCRCFAGPKETQKNLEAFAFLLGFFKNKLLGFDPKIFTGPIRAQAPIRELFSTERDTKKCEDLSPHPGAFFVSHEHKKSVGGEL